MFLRLGLTSFGGPVAHLGFFRDDLVARRRWVDDRTYADLVALCQFLPGPASSQVGMALGLRRAGFAGLIAAWIGFTLPSAVLLVAFAFGVGALGDLSQMGWVLGIKAAVVAVVAHALIGMARSLTPDAVRATIAAVAMIVVILVPSPLSQIGAILCAGAAGFFILKLSVTGREEPASPLTRLPRSVAVGSLSLFALLLVGLPILATVTGDGSVGLFDAFYRTGSLVFGGGHVVLPLLQAETVQIGLVDPGTFLAGYGAAQAVPGPLFTFAAFLGAVTTSAPTGLAGASIALVAIFLPSALLLVGTLPFWESLRSIPRAQSALMGANAGVVGLVAAALYSPVISEGIHGPATLVIAVVAFIALAGGKTPPWAVIFGSALLGWALL